MKIKVGDYITDRHKNIALIVKILNNCVGFKISTGLNRTRYHSFESLCNSIKNGDIKILRGYNTPLYKVINSHQGSSGEK